MLSCYLSNFGWIVIVVVIRTVEALQHLGDQIGHLLFCDDSGFSHHVIHDLVPVLLSEGWVTEISGPSGVNVMKRFLRHWRCSFDVCTWLA